MVLLTSKKIAQTTLSKSMLAASSIAKRYLLGVLLSISTVDSQAELPIVAQPSVKQVQLALKTFRQCVKDKRPLVVSAAHEICGVIAENRTELLSFLPCLARHNFIYSRALESYPVGGRFEYRCSDELSVVVKVELKGQQFIVTGIGYLVA